MRFALPHASIPGVGSVPGFCLVARRAFLNWAFVGYIIFWLCLFCGWVFSRFFLFVFRCLMTSDVGMIANIVTFWCTCDNLLGKTFEIHLQERAGYCKMFLSICGTLVCSHRFAVFPQAISGVSLQGIQTFGVACCFLFCRIWSRGPRLTHQN